MSLKLRTLGTISRTHGVDGMLVVESSERRAPKVSEVWVGFSESFSKPMAVESIKAFPGGLYLKLKAFKNPESARSLVNQAVFCPEEVLRARGKYFQDEILDSTMVDADNAAVIGRVVDIWIMPASDVWVVRTDKGDLPVPVVDGVIISVDTSEKKIRVRLPLGLEDILNEEDDRDDNDPSERDLDTDDPDERDPDESDPDNDDQDDSDQEGVD